MKSAVVFSRKSDEWATPKDVFDSLDREFHFNTDAACTPENGLCAYQIYSALDSEWSDDGDYKNVRCFLNPPYSRCREFMAKAAAEAAKGCIVVCLVPARTDTRWWHAHVYDEATHQWRPGVEVRFIRGRLKFGGAENGAPFPSCVVIFRPPT